MIIHFLKHDDDLSFLGNLEGRLEQFCRETLIDFRVMPAKLQKSPTEKEFKIQNKKKEVIIIADCIGHEYEELYNFVMQFKSLLENEESDVHIFPICSQEIEGFKVGPFHIKPLLYKGDLNSLSSSIKRHIIKRKSQGAIADNFTMQTFTATFCHELNNPVLKMRFILDKLGKVETVKEHKVLVAELETAYQEVVSFIKSAKRYKDHKEVKLESYGSSSYIYKFGDQKS